MRKSIEVGGIVQGVGFRPFIHRLASSCGVNGSVGNTARGVTIEIEGTGSALQSFLERLPAELPPLARITRFAVRDLPATGETGFQIVASSHEASASVLVSPDIAVCPDCLREMFDPADRRYRYPLINCTNCGPRFTIIRRLPYDRPNTSMDRFPMCDECRREYEDPTDRRFHAQPNACWECGPRLDWWDSAGSRIECDDPIAAAAAALARGEIVAIKGLGGFHLAVDATNREAVQRLRERKGRVDKPFAVMVPAIDAARALCEIGSGATELLSPQRPIVLMPWKRSTEVAEAVAPRSVTLGLFLPYTPMQFLLFAAGAPQALVMTSANVSEEPIAIDNRDAVARLGGIADSFLVHDRDILRRCDDTVMRLAGGSPRQVRRSRGFVPAPIALHCEVPSVLAVGAELKNSVCITRGNEAMLSQHVGDIENLEAFRFFEEVIAHMKQVFEIDPEIVACDLHPDYFPSRWARSLEGKTIVEVQHHHAHVASCMAENGLTGKVIGIALDGTGYGTDGTIWGGEILVADYASFDRVASFEETPMPGGEAAIRQPWRMALAHLDRSYGRDLFNLEIPFVRQLDRGKATTLLGMISQRFNSPVTTSCGRLFDAVAALIGVRESVNYEAQAAIELEAVASEEFHGSYAADVHEGRERLVIGTAPLIEAIVGDLRRNVPAPVISSRFHRGIIEALARCCRIIGSRTGLRRVCLSGGSFQNRILLEGVIEELTGDRFEVFTHASVPTGDGGIALGQAMVAAARMK
ncbi:MAG: carbamoyltransferase HypF [Thermoanaerobaculia bacterium]